MKAEAAVTEPSDVVEDLDHLVRALSQGKVFVRNHKEYPKNAKVLRLVQMDPFISGWHDFLLKHGILPDKSYLLLRLRAAFTSAPPDKSFADMFEIMLKLGLNVVLATTEDGQTAESWLRSLVLQWFAAALEGADVSSVDDDRLRWRDDFGYVIAKFSQIQVCDIHQFLQDLEFVRVILDAGCAGNSVKAAVAKNAHDAMTSPSFTLLHAAMEKSAVGIELMSAVRDLLRRGAHDELGDTRLKLATDVFKDSAMFRAERTVADVSVDGPNVVIVNADLVLGKNPQFFKLLTDALQYSLEAFKLFSHVRAEGRVVDITYLLKQVMEAIIAADIALTWQLSVPVSDFVEVVGPCDTPRRRTDWPSLV